MTSQIWKRKPQYMVVGERASDDLHATWAGPINTQMYGDGLQNLCRKTENNIMRIKSSMTRVDPCIEYGIQHWHLDSRPASAQAHPVTAPDKEKVSWHDPGVMFASFGSTQSLASQSTCSLASENVTVASNTAPHNFCYLCSTLEEHQRHLLNSRPVKRSMKPRKPRINYVAPPPRVKVKVEEPTAVAEILYRIVVVTGVKGNAGTSANVHISLHGSEDTARTQLKKGRGSSMFCFMRGTTETFFYKGPRVGNLTYITIEHDGLEKKHAWYLEHIVVTNMLTDQSWMFVCNNWLSLHHSDFRIKRDIEAALKEKVERELEVTVITGHKKMAGTDARVYLTLYGKSGMSPKLHLPDDKNKKRFERNSEDKFKFMVKDIGEIKRIRIEHDGSGLAAGWNLSKVIIQDIQDPSFSSHFNYGGWIASDVGDGKLWRELRAQTKQDKEILKGRAVSRGKNIRYHVTVKTGDVKYAGTDANVFIQFVGPKGTTRKIHMDDAKDNFERGMVEQFDLRGIDVGPLTRIVVSHDNTGAGAGWFLEDVTVKRYLTKEEKIERLKRMKKFHKDSPERRRKRYAERLNKEDRNKTDNSSDSSESESDTSDEEKNSKKRDKSRAKDYADEVFNRDGKILRIPEYERYYFVCRKWLAKDEADGLTSREMTVDHKETVFKECDE
ncbi:lipoxygenase homology domain-containing protein 1-like isoform X1 [Haliotis cracherodii]|uniref:lipoxygenase homology domain-containing protein 1-like isoform X1 n=1 Tax=Haliotis cracherodii TaxID=6455 RepID=UPI0039E7CB66